MTTTEKVNWRGINNHVIVKVLEDNFSGSIFNYDIFSLVMIEDKRGKYAGNIALIPLGIGRWLDDNHKIISWNDVLCVELQEVE